MKGAGIRVEQLAASVGSAVVPAVPEEEVMVVVEVTVMVAGTSVATVVEERSVATSPQRSAQHGL